MDRLLNARRILPVGGYEIDFDLPRAKFDATFRRDRPRFSVAPRRREIFSRSTKLQNRFNTRSFQVALALRTRRSVKLTTRFAYFPTANAKAPGQMFDLTAATAMSGCICDDCLAVHGITKSTTASSDKGAKRGGPVSPRSLVRSALVVLISFSSISSSSSSSSYVITKINLKRFREFSEMSILKYVYRLTSGISSSFSGLHQTVRPCSRIYGLW